MYLTTEYQETLKQKMTEMEINTRRFQYPTLVMNGKVSKRSRKKWNTWIPP
jgi:3-deoxy-D-manno-octulosonic-acid transferase